MPNISIVIPTYNRAHLLPRAIQSVLKQTYKDLEIIIVDDASTDETETIIKQLRNKRIRYIKHRQTRGPGASRNTGIEVSQGKYIAFLDSDDEWYVKKLEEQIKLFQKKDSKAGLIYTGVALIDQDKSIVKERWIPKYRGYIFEKNLAKNFILSGSSTVMVKRNALEKVGKFDESLLSCEDWDLWIRISKCYEFDFVPQILVKCFSHSQRISSNFERVILGLKLFSEKYRKEINKQNKTVKAQHYFHIGNHFCYYGESALAKKYLWLAFSMHPINPIYFFSPILFTLLWPKAYTKISFITRLLRHKIYHILF